MADFRRRKKEDFIFGESDSKNVEIRTSLFSARFPLVFGLGALVAAGLFGGFVIFSELNTRVAESDALLRELELKTEKLLAERNEIEVQLSRQVSSQTATADQIRNYEATIESLQSQVDHLSSELRDFIAENPGNEAVQGIDEQIDESRTEIEKLSNSVFSVSIVHRSLSDNALADIEAILGTRLGFKLAEVRANRGVTSNRIFYYDDSARSKAEVIALAISEVLGIELTPAKGQSDYPPTTVIIWINA